MTREAHLIAINAAQLAGFTHFAEALLTLYRRTYGPQALSIKH
jgi:hypothetical protein